jgi:hypothetical protein
MLPIHAAGYHEKDSSRTAVNRVVSSYVPTLRALAFARTRSQTLQRQRPKAKLIAIPNAPSKKDFKGA